MAQIDVLVPLRDIPVNSDELLSIQRNDLVPLLNDQYRLNHYADGVIQAQSVLLNGVDPQLTLQLSQTIEQLFQAVAESKIYVQMEYPKFVKNAHPLDNFAERLSKKINSLQTLQSSNDIVITQMQLSQQLSLSLLDRYKEAQQVLIPAWQYHVKQSQQSSSTIELEKLDNSREKLIHTLKKSLQKPTL